MERAADLLNRWVGHSTPGAAYVHFDRTRVLHEHYAGLADLVAGRPVGPATSFHGFSVTKTLTAVAVLRAAQAGLLQLDDPVRTHLPTMPYPGPITLRHLLGHTAGLPNPLPLAWVHAQELHATFDRDAFFAGVFARHRKLAGVPGERFAYSNLGYVLLGQVLERVYGMPYEHVIARQVLEPAGVPPGAVGFAHPLDGTHATGHLRTPSLLAFMLPLLVDTRTMLGPRVGRWRTFRPFLLNGAAYGGTLGTATGYRIYLQALLADGPLLTAPWRERLFAEGRTTAGRPTGMALGWFTGALNGVPYVAHAGGGGGYYAELRLYPGLGRGSVALFNRTGVRDERLLDRLDAGVAPAHSRA